MKKNGWIAFVFSLLVLSCGGEPKEQEVVSFDDIMGETGEEVMEEESSVDTTVMILEGAVNIFINNQLGSFDTTNHSEFHPLDRFTFNQREKILFKSKTDVLYGSETMVTPRAELFYYTFSDTTKTKNAFYNWLDCFGSDCAMVKLNEDMDAIKTPPSFALVYDTVIVAVDYRCEDQNFDWKPFQDSIKAQFGKDYKYQIKVGCGGPLNWK